MYRQATATKRAMTNKVIGGTGFFVCVLGFFFFFWQELQKKEMVRTSKAPSSAKGENPRRSRIIPPVR